MKDARRASLLTIGRRLVTVLGLVAVTTFPVVVGTASSASADASSVTVTGKHAWNPTTHKDNTAAATVTVSQTTNLINQSVQVSWTNFTPSAVLSAGAGTFGVVVYECDGVGLPANPTSMSHCFGTLDYIKSHLDGPATPSDTNKTVGVTSRSGTGQVNFEIDTTVDAPTLPCDSTNQCSIMIVPNWGGSSTNCEDHTLDNLVPGYTLAGSVENVAATCSWSNAISIPLSFAPSAADCPNRSPDFLSEGGSLLSRAVDQWRPGVCNDSSAGKGVSVGFSDLPEYQARTDVLSGGAQLAFTNQPENAHGGDAVDYAPVAVSAISVAYFVDDTTTGKPITGLKLNARLLAKMLTQSYSSGLPVDCKGDSEFPCAPEVSGNPSSLFTDPEFEELNPGLRTQSPPAGSSFPTVALGESDVTNALTSWIESDPDAAAFLNGQVDPWGMHVNTAYLPGTSPRYPAAAFQANDPGTTKNTIATGCNPPVANVECISQGLQGLWNPVDGLRTAAQVLVSGATSAKSEYPACTNQSISCAQYKASAPSPQGSRVAFAVVSSADASIFGLPTASLQTSASTFVSPDTTSMSAAVKDMTTDSATKTQSLDYSHLTDSSAYPLTLVDYAMTPTCGLTASQGKAISSFLSFLGSDGAQGYGIGPGTLAPGYLALNAAQQAQAESAASVSRTTPCSGGTPSGHPDGNSGPVPGGGAQPSSGTDPTSSSNPSGANPTDAPTSPGPAGDNASDGDTAASPDSGDGGDLGPTSGSSDSPVGSNGVLPPGSSGDGEGSSGGSAPAATQAGFALAHQDSAGFGGLVMPLVLIAGAVLLLGGPTVYLLGRTGALPVLVSRGKHLLGRG